MGNLINKFKPKHKVEEHKPFEERHNVKKLVCFITIVNAGKGNEIVNIFNRYEAYANFIQMGDGTANKVVYDFLGTVDNKKDIIFSIAREEYQEDLFKELNAYFVMNRKQRGISLSIDLTSIAGIKAYSFLANDI